MKISLHKLLLFGSIGLFSIGAATAAANEQQQKPFHNHNSLDVKTILENHHQPDTLKAHEKHFKGGDTLAYVTPWNNRGI